MRRVLLCMLDNAKCELCLLDMLDVLGVVEVMRCVRRLSLSEVAEMWR